MLSHIAFRGDFGIKTGKIHRADNIVNHHAKIIVFNKIQQIGWKKQTLFLTIGSKVLGFANFQN